MKCQVSSLTLKCYKIEIRMTGFAPLALCCMHLKSCSWLKVISTCPVQAKNINKYIRYTYWIIYFNILNILFVVSTFFIPFILST